MLLPDVSDLEYVLDTLRGNEYELRLVTGDSDAHVTNPKCEYICNTTDASCVRSEDQDCRRYLK
jgi:hypothetical protein